MKKSRYIRILISLFVYGLIGVAVLAVTSMWWLPVALPTLLRLGDVEVEAVERRPSGRLLMREVTYATDTVRYSLDRLELPPLHQYLWERFLGAYTQASVLDADMLMIEFASNANDRAETQQLDVMTTVRQVRAELVKYGQWVPPLQLDELSIRSFDGASLLDVHTLVLRDWELSLLIEHLWLSERIELRASMDPREDWSARFALKDLGFTLDLLFETMPDRLDLHFKLQRGLEQAVGEISFEAGDQLPSQASLSSERFTLDPDWLAISNAVAIEAVTLSEVDLSWQNNHYQGALLLDGAMRASERATLPLEGRLAFSGDLKRLRLDTLELVASWGQLHLSQSLEIELSDGSVDERAEFVANVDLAQQAFLPMSGRVNANLSLSPAMLAGPNIHFQLSGQDLVYDCYSIKKIDASGRLEGSVLSLEEVFVQPLAADDGGMELSGQVDLSTRKIDFQYDVGIASEWINTMIAPLTVSNVLRTSGQISGLLEQPNIEGNLAPLTFVLPNITPITISGAYQADGWEQWRVSSSVAGAGAEIDASLLARIGEGNVSVDLDRLVWTDPERPTLELQESAHFSYQYAGAASSPESRLVIKRFHLEGPELSIEVEWHPDTGLKLSLRNVTLRRLQRWVEQELPSLTIGSVELIVSQLRPNLLGSLGMNLATQAVGESMPLRVDLDAKLTSTGLSSERVEVTFANEPLLAGRVVAPVVFQLPISGEPFWYVLEEGELNTEIMGAVSPGFSEWLSRTTGYQLSGATFNMNVAGTVEQPTGTMELQVGSLRAPIAAVPTVNKIEIFANAESDMIEVEEFHFIVVESEVSGHFDLPTAGLVRAMRGSVEERKKWLSAASGRVELIDWEADDWVEFLPPLMRRSGRVSGLIELQPEWALSGRLSFQEFALRPTESMPSIDLIGGDLELVNGKFIVKGASAQVGGSLVVVEGWLDVNDWNRPLWEFEVEGTNVPLVRTTDMILRSDLNLLASRTESEEVPLLAGQLNLRSSTMLVEFDPLSANVETGPQSQPPYFSIKEPAIADWRFDLQVAGDSFMRVRSPYFRTQLTANFDLKGTFAEPLLVGTVRTVDGELRFPGAKMRITSGEAYIEQGRPNAIQLDFSGIAQKASYIITMEVTQTLDDPHIQFQSTPTLSNASIIRLLTTGSVSGGGVGSVGLYLGQGLLGAGGMDEQLADRLTVDLGEETSRSGRNTVGVRYDLSQDVFLEGGYDVYDAYNLDLIWSLFKR